MTSCGVPIKSRIRSLKAMPSTVSTAPLTSASATVVCTEQETSSPRRAP